MIGRTARETSALPWMALFVLCACAGHSQERFPKWEVATIGLTGSWERAEDVVVADVSNIVPLGSEKISDPPWPVSPSINEIYWCQADFHVDSVIKGKAPTAGKKFIWAAIRPGCGLERFRYGYEADAPPVTRVWFVREDGKYIRPAVDGGGVYFASFHAAFAAAGKPEDKNRFALLFLSPEALGMTPANYAVILRTPLELVRAILGDEISAQSVRSLANSPDPRLRTSACDYLDAAFHQTCK